MYVRNATEGDKKAQLNITTQRVTLLGFMRRTLIHIVAKWPFFPTTSTATFSSRFFTACTDVVVIFFPTQTFIPRL